MIEKPLAAITHILFDMDGLLLDTEVLYTIAQNKILEPFGIKFSAEVKSMMMGRKALEAAEIMVSSVRPKPLFWFSFGSVHRNQNWQILWADTVTDTETTFKRALKTKFSSKH